MHRKPIDLKLPARKESGRQPAHFIVQLAAASIICLFAAYLAFQFFFPAFRQPVPSLSPTQGEIIFHLQPQPVYEGQDVKFKAYSTCGNFTVLVDDTRALSGVSGQEFSLALPVGNHTLAARNGDCNATVDVQVIRPACESGKSVACVANGCAGTRTCLGAAWGECELPARKCPPGARVGCAYNSCSFGYSTCNKCGTEWSPCLPEGANQSQQPQGNQTCENCAG